MTNRDSRGAQSMQDQPDQPDFRALGLSTPWSAKAWRDAWDYLSDRHETRLWRLVTDLMPLGSFRAPVTAAVALVRALEGPVGARP